MTPVTESPMVHLTRAHEELVSGRCSSVEHQPVVCHKTHDSARRLWDSVTALGTRIHGVSTHHRVSSTIHSSYYNF